MNFKPKWRLRYMGIHLLSGKPVWKCYINFGGRLEETTILVWG